MESIRQEDTPTVHGRDCNKFPFHNSTQITDSICLYSFFSPSRVRTKGLRNVRLGIDFHITHVSILIFLKFKHCS